MKSQSPDDTPFPFGLLDSRLRVNEGWGQWYIRAHQRSQGPSMFRGLEVAGHRIISLRLFVLLRWELSLLHFIEPLQLPYTPSLGIRRMGALTERKPGPD